MKKKDGKKKERKYLSSFEIEQASVVSNVSEYYPLDKEKKVFEIPLHYEKASDLYFSNVDFMGKPNISDEATEDMVELLQDIPEGYKAELSITIDDYEEVPPEKVLKGINDALSFRHLRYMRESTSKGIKVGILMFVGMTLILIKTYGIVFDWWGDESVATNLFTYIIDLFGCVLIWEAVYALFIDRSEEIDFERTISKKVYAIKMYDPNNNEELFGEDASSLVSIMSRNKKKMLSNRMLLLSGFSLLALSVSDLFSAFVMANDYWDTGLLYYITVLVVGLLSAMVMAYVGITAIKIYKGKFTKNISGAIMTIIMLVLLVMNITGLFRNSYNTKSLLISTIFKMVVESSFVAGLTLRFSYFIQLNKSYRDNLKQ